jgi:hypothetical protein
MTSNVRSLLAQAVSGLFSVQLALPVAVAVLGWVSMGLESRAWTSFEVTGDLTSVSAQLGSQLSAESPAISTLTYASRIVTALAAYIGRAAFVLGTLTVFLALVGLRRVEIPWPVRLIMVVYAGYCVVHPVLSIR